jgi:Pyruvate/2-oxoacid:ferredoxin oxidoreductase gamma subunit
MKNLNIKVAGFGGQGVMMFGKILSYAAVQDNKQTL